MYLSKLELHGFKSFADRTVVDFSSGVTAVVGPNGCGKSNIVDAVRWVIGEQRARILRSNKMDDVIFNGTSSRRSLGMSEVLLTIENTRGVLPIEYSEVTIGRRLFRSGESEYLLNGVQCRLKDITDLFMDTGMGAGAYSVIELKMIEDILSDSAGDRRHMFEEAAGISKYKTRRGQTLRKLAGTQTDINRVRDIVEELDKRVRSLERQAKKASRFKRLDDRLTYLVQALALTEYSTLKLEKDGIKGQLTNSTDGITRLTTQLASLEASHEALRTEHIKKEQAVSSAQTELVHHLDMLRGAESDIRLNTERIESIDRDIARAVTDQKLALERVEELNAELTLSRALLIQAEPAAANSRKQLQTARTAKEVAESDLRDKRETFQVLSNRERSLLGTQSEHRRNIDRLRNRIELLDQDAVRLSSELKEITDSLKQHQVEQSHAAQTLVASRNIEQVASARLSDAKAVLVEKSIELDGVVSSQQDVERRLAALNAESALLESMLSSFDDLSESIQHLAAEPGWSKHELRTVADVITCDDVDRLAVDTALGEYASFIVVRSEKEAARAIGALKSDEKGRATFIVTDLLPSISPVRETAGLIPLNSRVRVLEPDFGTLPALLLHDCYLTGDLDRIIASAPTSGRYFSATGEWFDASGMRHGGSVTAGSSPATGRIGRREQFDSLKAEIHTVTDEVNDFIDKISSIRKDIDSIQAESVETELSEARAAASAADRIASQIDYQVATVEQRRSQLDERSRGFAGKRENSEDEIVVLEKELTLIDTEISGVHTSRTNAETELITLEDAARTAFSVFNEINIVSVQSENELERLIRECTRIEEDLERIGRESQRRQEQSAQLGIQREQTSENSTFLEIELARLRKDRNVLDEAAMQAKDFLAEIRVAVSDVEAQLRDIRRQREDVLAGESQQNIRLAEIDTRLTDLVETMAEDYEIDIISFTMDVAADFKTTAARIEIRELRSRIRNLGPVNALALESFDEEKERLDFLRTQLADLEAAETTLLTTISEINETASKRFNETFSAIQANFVKLFVELFGEEATADVVLVDPNDPLESPIEIMARPKGKKLSVLAQLSGGEKTLTAIALLFAIYLVKPSPFCILDEVDAPLDDANVNRFMHMIRTFSDTTQFILVTHNKRTMEAADCMYGITMAEQGVSKLVSVKFDSELELVA